MKKKNKKKIHRHRWEHQYSDCPFCGIGEYYECECGEVRDFNKKKV